MAFGLFSMWSAHYPASLVVALRVVAPSIQQEPFDLDGNLLSPCVRNFCHEVFVSSLWSGETDEQLNQK